MVVSAQLKRIYSFLPMKPYDEAALIKFAKIVSSFMNVVAQFNYGEELNSGVLGSATRKLTLDMKRKWLSHVKRMNLYQPGLAVFSEWLKDIADVQEKLLFESECWSREVELQRKGKSLHVCTISEKHREWQSEESAKVYAERW